jgi:pseudouridine-5'-phosphate glycosidase
MPYPKNLDVARRIEQTVRDNGAIPATIAVINGIPTVGLGPNELEILAKNEGSAVRKATTRDLAHVCANKGHAATTVASTMKLASLAGINTFATGGIGGVHRGAEISMDVSADLLELGRTPVTVVCAGIKSILDIPKSLEVLETQGVPVVCYQTKHFPAFFTNESGINAPSIVQDAKEVAYMMKVNQELAIPAGMVVANPNPNPMNAADIENVIIHALQEAERQGISGAKVTPFLLSRIERLSEGKSLESNIALVLNNAKLASKIAIEYSKLSQNSQSNNEGISTNSGSLKEPVSVVTTVKQEVASSDDLAHAINSPTTVASAASTANITQPSSIDNVRESNDVVVVGGAVMDIIGKVTSQMSLNHTSNPGHVTSSAGGVGRNIADHLSRLGVHVGLSTVLGNDESGHSILNHSRSLAMDTSAVKIVNQETSVPSDGTSGNNEPEVIRPVTARYSAIHDNNGELVIGIADMSLFKLIDVPYI